MQKIMMLRSTLLMIFACCPLLGYAQQTEAVMEKEEANKAVVLQMTEAINERDFAALDDLIATDLERHSAATPGIEINSLQQFKAFLQQDLSAVPDAQQEILFMLAEGDMVAVRAMYRGTQTGPMGPFPPSGKALALPFLGMLRLEDGKIAEIWVEWDNLSALTQLGHFSPRGDQMQTKEESTAPLETDAEEAAKALARQWFEEVINKRNLDAIADIYTADYIHHGPEGAELRGHAAVRSFAASILAASDDRHAIVEQQVIEGDLVVTRFTSSGHHTGPWQGMAPTGEVWTTEGIVISRIEDGKIAEDWEVIHISGM